MDDYKPLMPNLTEFQGPKIVYVYSPTCIACKLRGPGFDKEASGLKNIYSFNGKAHSAVFEKHTGTQIKFFPSIYGFSKSGRVVLIEGNPNRKQLETILIALEKT